MNTTYSIDDGTGLLLIVGLELSQARRIAQKLANESTRDMYIYDEAAVANSREPVATVVHPEST